MKQLTCEMCGSTDLVKQDGVFVCQSCGTKYSIEEAKKMMIEGPVDVSGSTVKVDTSDELENLYQIARRARDENNAGNAAKYYDMILVRDPTSWEAAFYTVYFQAMQCKIAEIQSAAISVQNCETNVLSLIYDYVPVDEQEYCVNIVASRCIVIAIMLAKAARKNYTDTPLEIQNRYKQEFIDNVCAAVNILYFAGTHIELIFNENNTVKANAAKLWEKGVELHESILPFVADARPSRVIIDNYVKKIEEYDPSYAQEYWNKRNVENENRKSKFKKQLKFLKKIPIPLIVFGILGIVYACSRPRADGARVIYALVGILFILLGVLYRILSIRYQKKLDNDEI